MKNLLRFLAFILMAGSAYAQSNLPACEGRDVFRWTNCFGTLIQLGGMKYIGEFKDGKYNGQGTLYTSNGVATGQGIWANGKFIGPAPVQQASVANQTVPVATIHNIEEILRSSLPKCPTRGTYDNCFGTETYGSGNKFVGEFKDGSYHGKGVLFSAKGEIIKSGLWIDGELKEQQNHLQTNGLAAVENSKLERDRLSAEVEIERKKRQELEEQLRVAQQRPATSQTASNTSIGKRIALVMGNANYKVRPLKNSGNDADDVSRSLKTTGFEVIDLRDATLTQMRTAVRQFGDRLINNDVGLVYYSGHGVEVKGRNYFIPVNADIQREDEIADQGLDVSLILEKMSTAGKGVNILIVDACRDDPFGRSFRSSSRGLAQMDAPRGTIIAYATSPGKVASDGDPRERNSPYTKHLVKAMQSPNKPIEQVFKEVRRAVQDETKNQQTPWENTSLSGDFFFRVQR
jgi:hypothetical protein